VLFAAKVAAHTDRITEADVDSLRAHGMADEQIFDVALAAAASCFFADATDSVAG
jgi:alkylhydroperoxidase family enzyme